MWEKVKGWFQSYWRKPLEAQNCSFIDNGRIRIWGLDKHGLRILLDTHREILDTRVWNLEMSSIWRYRFCYFQHMYGIKVMWVKWMTERSASEWMSIDGEVVWGPRPSIYRERYCVRESGKSTSNHLNDEGSYVGHI